MKKEEFEKRKAEIQSQIDSWKRELEFLKEAYIASNQEFPIGSKVCIVTPTKKVWAGNNNGEVIVPSSKREAFVSGYEIYCDKVVPIFKKVKKDGTMSQKREYVYAFETIEKIEP
jgi:hypothetical protein